MPKNIKILICGLGAIGSHLIGEIVECVKQNQIPADIQFDIADDDIVECKNVKFQNFTSDEIGESKATALANRYRDFCWLEPLNTKIEKIKQLQGYNLVICCADNFVVRELIFRYCHKNNADFLDGRAEGRLIMAFQKTKSFKNKTDLEVDLGTLNLKDEDSGSCQRKADLEKGYLQKGYKIVALCLTQMLLNYLRGEENHKILIRI